jgi:hypothetical protein
VNLIKTASVCGLEKLGACIAARVNQVEVFSNGYLLKAMQPVPGP